jgi:hypothetical protein
LLLTLVIPKKLRPNGGKFDQSGVDVMITIVGETIGVFLKKNNVMINFLHNLGLVRVKDANFFADFGGDENIFKNHSIGPWSLCPRSKSFFLKTKRDK